MQSNFSNLRISAFALTFFVQFSIAQKKTHHFKSDIDFGNGTVFSTFIDMALKPDTFTLTSPKNADVRIMGGKARLGRILGKSPKKGIIVTISGTRKNDSLFGEAEIPMVGKLKFRGAVNGEALNGKFFKEQEAIGTLRGRTSTENKIDYSPLYPQLIKTAKDNIYSTGVLQTRQWKNFEKDVEKLCRIAHDDIDLYFGFNMLTQQLPFTHLSLQIADESHDDETVGNPKSVIFEERNPSTAYLKIKNFSDSQQELESVLPRIVANPAYKNLIIDLRDNGGGGIGAAFALAKYIVTEDLEVGYFVTNKLPYSGFEPDLFKALPAVQPKNTNEFGDMLRTSPGARLIFQKPDNAVFSGKIYVLTNGKTGSTCEPVVYAMKTSKMATIIGERTYGGMLAASPFVASGKYLLMVPIADFYTHDGVRLDKVGVEPDVTVNSADAEKKAIEMIAAEG